jgi:glycosyltransferase involved in cell wall biosynthesis
VNGFTYRDGEAGLANALSNALDQSTRLREGAAATGRDFSWDVLAASLAKVVRA